MCERIRPNVGKDMASSENRKEIRAVAAQRDRERELRAEIEESGKIQIMENPVHQSPGLLFYSKSNIKPLTYFRQVEAASNLQFEKSL